MTERQPAGTASHGCVVVVVGPSGAGKDTLIDHAARVFAGREDVIFARRVITRAGDAGGEAHHAVSEAEFDAMQANGEFIVSWGAHGLRYGIPAEVGKTVENGCVVVVNGSRAALAGFRAAFPHLVVVNVTASPEVLAARLAARGRESLAEIRQRLERSAAEPDGDYPVITIDNNGPLEAAGRSMVDAILSARQASRR